MNKLFTPWQSVKVTDSEHPRFDHAGVVFKEALQGDATGSIRFEADGEVVAVPVAAVRVL